MKIQDVSLERTAAKEIFARAAKEILRNIRDVNVPATEPRTLTLAFTFVPYPDRSGVQIKVKSKTGLGQLDSSGAVTTAFIALGDDGEFHMFDRDIRQEMLFGDEEKPTDGKTAAANP
jgi:hypothetical protein